MEEEITDRTVRLAVSTTKLSLRTVMNGIRTYLNHENRKIQTETAKDQEAVHGKQTVQELIGQNQGVSSIPIAETELKGFEKVAKKYGVDFAVRKDASVDPPRYTIFFKARDQDALTAAYKEYAAQTVQRKERPSVRKELQKQMTRVVEPDKVREKTQELER